VLHPEEKVLLPPVEIAAVFEKAGCHLDDPHPIVASCGSGVTACVLALALDTVKQAGDATLLVTPLCLVTPLSW
jgi:thiosulfate/3-mercaptopyruvate sulfurtransferase